MSFGAWQDPSAISGLVGRLTLSAAPHETFVVVAPATGQTFASIPRGTSEDVVHALDAAREAQPAWAALDTSARASIITRFHDLVLDRSDEILDLIQIETGKARRHAFEEVVDVALIARYYASVAERILRPRRRRGAVPGLTATWEHLHPKGVVGLISPWNYPLSLGVTDAIPALLAGNAAILKPDLQTTLTALWALDALATAGLPPGVMQVVSGAGPDVGPALIGGVDYLAFTGSTVTGRDVARQAAARLIGCSLELGGKNAMIVRADADLERAARGAVRGCFTNAGQLCLSIERLYVQSSVYDAFAARFVELTGALELGSGLDFEPDLGSLTSGAQFRKVSAQVDEAVNLGATMLAGGQARPDVGPLFYEPTILEGVTAEMRVAEEETFGPVVSLYRFESDDEAVRLANGGSYGLNASIWSRDVNRAKALAVRLEAGTVNINEAYAAAWASVDAPMGGVRDSGLGRRHGIEGILKYTESQTVAVQRGVPLDLARPGLGRRGYRRLVGQVLKRLRHVPGLR